MNLRHAIERAYAERQLDPRLIQPRLERLADGRFVVVIERISQLPLITGAPLMAHLLRQAAMVIPDEYPDLRADINRCLRQVAGT